MPESSLLRTDKEITEIYYRNVESVFRTAVMYLGNHTDAEDVVQNVFIRFIDSNPQFGDRNHERAWFITVTKNMCKNYLRSFWKSRREDIEEIETPAYTENFYEDGGVLKELKKLKRDYRVVIYLYYYEGFSVRDIAEAMGRKESTIQTWLARGREKLKLEIVRKE